MSKIGYTWSKGRGLECNPLFIIETYLCFELFFFYWPFFEMHLTLIARNDCIKNILGKTPRILQIATGLTFQRSTVLANIHKLYKYEICCIKYLGRPSHYLGNLVTDWTTMEVKKNSQHYCMVYIRYTLDNHRSTIIGHVSFSHFGSLPQILTLPSTLKKLLLIMLYFFSPSLQFSNLLISYFPPSIFYPCVYLTNENSCQTFLFHNVSMCWKLHQLDSQTNMYKFCKYSVF